MEFPFAVNELLPETITVIRDGNLPFSSNRRGSEYHNKMQRVATVVDMMGQASAKAQGLKAPITTFQRLQNTRHTLYIMRDDSADTDKGAVVGILKVGKKKLFLVDIKGTTHEVEPLCVLDFYIHESKQRNGYGKKLFERFLQVEGKAPHELAIDRPSSKFLSFLRRHYGLSSYPTQANNFVVFNQFFQGINTVASNGQRRSHQSDINTSVSFLPPSQRESNLTHNRQSPSKSTGSASAQTQSALALRKGASEGLCPDQPDGLVSPLRGILPSTSAALSPSKSAGSIQGDSTHPAAIGMENQSPVPTQCLNWTLSGYHQRQKARGDGGVQDTAPYLRLRQSCLGGGGTLLSGNMGSNAVWSRSSSGLDCLHYSKYGSGAAHYRPALHKMPYSSGSYFSQRQY